MAFDAARAASDISTSVPANANLGHFHCFFFSDDARHTQNVQLRGHAGLDGPRLEAPAGDPERQADDGRDYRRNGDADQD